MHAKILGQYLAQQNHFMIQYVDDAAATAAAVDDNGDNVDDNVSCF